MQLANQEKAYMKSKNTQEAHECVRPTHIEISGLNESGYTSCPILYSKPFELELSCCKGLNCSCSFCEL